jgi:Ni/Co efflux regulator RcnB
MPQGDRIMKSQRIVAALAAASLAFGSGAFAQSTGAQDQAMRARGIQNPNGPLLSPQQLRDQQQAERGTNTGIQGYGRNDDRNRGANRGASRGDAGGGNAYHGNSNRGDSNRGDAYRGDSRGAYRQGRNDARPDRRDGHGAGPDHSFYRGDRLPSQYRSRQYVVDDWRGHRLSAPPRGYQWVQSGGDYLLVAIASGVIASILLNH